MVDIRKRKSVQPTDAEPAQKKASPDPTDNIPIVDPSEIIPFDKVGDLAEASQ